MRIRRFSFNLSFNLIAIFAICISGLLLYSHTLNSPFIFDGINLIADNTSIRNLNDLGAIFKFWPSRFIAFLSFSLNYHIHKLDVPGYHIVNLAVHLATTLLVLWFIQLLFLTPRLKDTGIAKEAKLTAFLCSLVFVSHPVQTQAVTYIYQRSTILASLFYLLSISLYLKARLISNKNLSSVLCYSFSIISAIVGMFTKEVLFTLPFMILLLEFYFLKKEEGLTLKYALPFLLLLAVIPLTLILTRTVYFKAQGILADKNVLPSLSSKNYLLTQFRVIITYIRLLFLPINQNLDYDYPISNSLFEIPTLISLVILLVILITAFRLYSRYPLISFGIIWFFLTLIPESSIITLNDVINEHRLYLPLLGFSLFLICSLYHLFKERTKLFLCLIIIYLSFYSTLTYFRNIIWRDDLTLWSDTVEKSPNKARGYYNKGTVYSKKGQYEKAILDLTRAINIDPDFAHPYNNRGTAYANKGEYEKAIADFIEALTIDPNYAEAYYNLANACSNIGQYERAISNYCQAIRINPRYIEAYNNRGTAYLAIRQYDNAISDFTKALEIYPTRIGLPIPLNPTRVDHPKPLRMGLKEGPNPEIADIYYNRMLAYIKKKEYKSAYRDIQKMQELGYKFDPKFLQFFNPTQQKSPDFRGGMNATGHISASGREPRPSVRLRSPSREK